MVALTLHILIFSGIFIILTLSLNLIIGFSGQVSLGHAAFYGIGAYVSAILVLNFNAPYFVALIGAAMGAGLAGIFLGLPTLRLKEDYLAIVTLGFGVIVVIVALNVEYIGGTGGITGIPVPTFFSKIKGTRLDSFLTEELGKIITKKIYYLFITWAMVLVTIIFMYRLKKSRVGMALAAIREDDITAQVMGINTTKYKVMAFGLGSAFAGIAGSLYSTYIRFIEPTDFGLMTSITILCMVVVGGIGSIPGSIFGGAMLTTLPLVLTKFADYQNMVYGALLVLILIIRNFIEKKSVQTVGWKSSMMSIFGIFKSRIDNK